MSKSLTLDEAIVRIEQAYRDHRACIERIYTLPAGVMELYTKEVEYYCLDKVIHNAQCALQVKIREMNAAHNAEFAERINVRHALREEINELRKTVIGA